MTFAGFAETAAEAYPRRTLHSRLRGNAKSAVLLAAPYLSRRHESFVRCLYSHAVFPEHRKVFQQTLRWMLDRGDVISLESLEQILAQGKLPEGRYFHLSFDDAFACVYENAVPILDTFRVPATIFACSGFPGASGEELKPFFQGMRSYRRPLRPMSWDQLRAFHASGGSIGVHSRSHPRLSALEHNSEALCHEIMGAKRRIESELGTTCGSFAWPFGRPIDIGPKGRQMVREAGFKLSFSATRGRIQSDTSRFDIPRHQLEFHWPFSDLKAWISGFGE